jgi:hypothetical protein
MQQVRELRRQLAPKETELSDIRQTKQSLGPPDGPFYVDLAVDVSDRKASRLLKQEEAYRSLARTIKDAPLRTESPALVCGVVPTSTAPGLFGGIHAPQHFFEVVFDQFIAKAGPTPQGFPVEHQD